MLLVLVYDGRAIFFYSQALDSLVVCSAPRGHQLATSPGWHWD